MTSSPPIDWRSEFPAPIRRDIERLVHAQRTLEDVVSWGLSQRPARFVSNVVVQDEYTHDVVIAHPSGCILVYDAT